MVDEFSDPQTWAQLERALSLEEYSAQVAREVTDFLGEPTTRLAMTNVFPGQCSTCGEPMVSQMDVSADFDPKLGALVTAHHSVCRPSSLNKAGHGMAVGTSAVTLGSVGAGPDGVPVMVVNPSMESVLLAPAGRAPYRVPGRRERRKAWTNVTLTEFAAHGFVPGRREFPPVVRDVEASMTDETLTIRIDTHTWRPHEWTVRIPQEVNPQLTRAGGVGVSVLTKTLPPRLGIEGLPDAFTDPDAMIGWIPLTD